MITHFIDSQFSHPIHLGTNENKIDFVAPMNESEKFQTKFKEALIGKTIEEANVFLKKTLSHYRIIKFENPLENKYQDYVQ